MEQLLVSQRWNLLQLSPVFITEVGKAAAVT